MRNRISGRPVANAKVELNLTGTAANPVKLGTFLTDQSGTVADAVAVPPVPPAEYQLVIDVTSPLGRDHVVKKVEVQHPARIFASSDKPVYQPGQTIHMRSLVLNSRTEKPFANEPVTFAVSDPKGNKVFKETHRTSAFGIVSADFNLATELNLGRYQIRAVAASANAERAVEVQRYVLPKFQIQITTSKGYYLPGQTVNGLVTAKYFFGKAVAGASVKLVAATLQEKPVVIKELQGQTDASGQYSFDFALPDFLVGMPQKNEQAFLDLTAEVRDSADHLEQKVLSLSVSKNELEITVIPEAGALVPGIENVLYVLTAYPDGRPAPCNVRVDGKAFRSDAAGLCVIGVTPATNKTPFEIEATDGGKHARVTYRPDPDWLAPAFLLRSDRTVYQAGETAEFSVVSPETDNTVFLDVIKDGQTVLTKSIALKNHKADYALNLPPTLVGALRVNAYVITPSGEDRGCPRLIYVNPASGLNIAAKLSAPTFRPGETAKLDFSVTDAEGKPTPAALGIAAVDEAVFAMHENRPGLLKQFLDAESELLKPRYQIKLFDSPTRLLETKNQALAAAYFASLEQPGANSPDELVRRGYIPAQLVQRVRAMRGTPAYEKYRNDPQNAAVFRLLEENRETYSLREATGTSKVQAVEAHRRNYFKGLGHALQVGFLGLLFLLPIYLLIYCARPGVGINPQATGTGQTAQYVSVAGAFANQLTILALLPLICYPVGLIASEITQVRASGWTVLVFESAVVLLTLYLQKMRITRAAIDGLSVEMAPLRVSMWVFLAQFAISRLGIVVMAHTLTDREGLLFPWGLGSLVAPVVVLAALDAHVRSQLAAKGVTAPVIRMGAGMVLLIIVSLFVLAGMLLPALAKAKSKAEGIRLLSDLKQVGLAKELSDQENSAAELGSGAPRIRRDFPETLLWRPQLITDVSGQATLEIPLADSITTWRASIDGVSAAGRMGSIEVPVPVFQDFFVDLDLPVQISLGDQISVPLTCYNYLKDPQDVRLTVVPGSWFESAISELNLHLGPSEVRSIALPMKVLRVGQHSLRVTARSARVTDAIEREIRVVPAGDRLDYTKNDLLKDAVVDVFTIPPEAIPDSPSLWAKFYPSRFSEVVEGLDSIFQAPYGCFEQTSSTTYPNVLVLDYMKRMGRLTPEIEIKARKFINAGYQRLLTFEVAGGGFEWFGRSPANICLTAYGILEFTDMSRVHSVDQAIIERARHWLVSQQNSDGSWDENHRGWTWSGRGSMTAFVAWALAEAGDRSRQLERALSYVRNHPQELDNTYAKALAANAFLAHDRTDTLGRQLARELKDAAISDCPETVHWSSTGQSVTFSHDAGMETECTALCVMALMKAGEWPQSVKQALHWISAHKFANGTLGSTQATILCTRALLDASAHAFGQEFETTVTVLLNGQAVDKFRVTKENSDVLKQVNLTPFLHFGENRIELRQSPTGEMPFQLAGAYWKPAGTQPEPVVANSDPVQIEVGYDHTTLAVDDQLLCRVTARNNTGRLIHMVIVDLGIPPGFDVDATGFEAMQQKSQIAKFEITGNQVILYLTELSESGQFQFSYSLRAKYPLRVQTPPSAVYEYYQPQNRAESKPAMLQVISTN